MISEIIRSLLITCSISSVVGGAFILLFNVAIWRAFTAGFVISFIAQFIIFYFWSVHQETKSQIEREKLNEFLMLEQKKRLIEIPCAYCGVQNTTELFFNTNNIFKCVSCNQDNVILMEFSAVRTTKTPENAFSKISKIASEDDVNTINIKGTKDSVTIG